MLESGNTTVVFKPHAGDAVQSAERALWLINAVGSPRIRIVFDYSHFYVEGYPLEESLRTLIAFSPLIVVKDSEGTSEKHNYLLPGDGKTDYAAYFPSAPGAALFRFPERRSERPRASPARIRPRCHHETLL